MLQKDQVLGRNYRIIGRLGAGGMGMVFRATDVNLHREVAIKIMHPDAAKDQSVVQRFLNEGRILAMVRHPVIIEVYAAGVDDATNIPFLVMEFVEGQTLEEHRDELHKDPARLLQYCIELLGGIHACHQKGVIHRDLKPANVLINKNGQLKLVDFGIAKTSQKMTRTGVAIGTPHYMSPEQCLGKTEITAASDIYAMGVMLWEFLVGRLPFEAEKDATDPGLSVALQHLNQEPPWQELEAAPAGRPFLDLLRRVLAKKPDQRPAIPDIIEHLKRELNRLRPGDVPVTGDGQTIGEIYRIIAEVGAGGMGKVYKALDTTLNRTVAIKVMNEETMAIPGVVERFLQEGQLLATVGHPNVLNIYASGTDRATKRPFLVMEYIDGALLSDLKAALRKDGARLAPLMIQLLEGLQACHRKNIIHRDLKPSNIMVTREGLLKIFDFGIAKAHAHLTRTGTTVGTPQYMSPEQCTGKREITAKSDVYSIGIIFWELIFGEPPFRADTTSNPDLAVALQHIQATLPMTALPEGSLFLPFLPMVKRMLDKEPASRPEIEEILTALEGFASPGEHESNAATSSRRRRLSQRQSSVKSLFDTAERERQTGGWKPWLGAAVAVLAAGGIWFLAGRPGLGPAGPGPQPGGGPVPVASAPAGQAVQTGQASQAGGPGQTGLTGQPTPTAQTGPETTGEPAPGLVSGPAFPAASAPPTLTGLPPAVPSISVPTGLPATGPGPEPIAASPAPALPATGAGEATTIVASPTPPVVPPSSGPEGAAVSTAPLVAMLEAALDPGLASFPGPFTVNGIADNLRLLEAQGAATQARSLRGRLAARFSQEGDLALKGSKTLALLHYRAADQMASGVPGLAEKLLLTEQLVQAEEATARQAQAADEFQAGLDGRLARLEPPASVSEAVGDLRRLAFEFKREEEALRRLETLRERYVAAFRATRDPSPAQALAILDEIQVIAPDNHDLDADRQDLQTRLARLATGADAATRDRLETERLAGEILTRDVPELAGRLAKLAAADPAAADRLRGQALEGLQDKALQAGSAAEFATLQKRALGLFPAKDPRRAEAEQAFAARRAARQAGLLARWQDLIARHNPEPAPKSLAAKLKALGAAEGKDVLQQVAPLVRARYLAEARRLEADQPAKALGLVKGLQSLSLGDPEGEAKGLAGRLADRVPTTPAPEPPPAATDQPGSEAVPPPPPPDIAVVAADPKLSAEEITTQLETLTAPENVAGKADAIAGLLKALEKKKGKAAAADFRERAVKALVDIAEEHTSYQSWDLARQAIDQARLLSPKHPQVARVLQLLPGGAGSGPTTPAAPPAGEPPKPAPPAKEPAPTPAPAADKPATPAPASPSGGEGKPLPTDKAGMIAALEAMVEPEAAAANVGAIVEMTKKLEKMGAGPKAKEFRQKAVRALLDVAEEHGSYSDFAAAARTYQQALQIIPNHPEALKGLELVKGKQ
ncbi:MAG: serine/threonine protein kinase [Candidatus Riflebacteria bacterium]|nr:serine/threonine protein kinase [Candidatus Riflebacteria bacterium]